ncbi:hypothetical protein NM208_g6992 [Fusarium decemcellulare]|uniref:Uncharacterized protein n=2 Tax=Fusarium decemcellulare TaxID=57161 RepID=A0ACC1S499_9HYPO|nr:hypothetical protein NM208_g8790 [Fusarium decemcellulare]KAJ3535784.1 hypothetical protein NM208_g6992 [Fusarium decemcellulare]
MSSAATSKSEADYQIEKLRRERGFDGQRQMLPVMISGYNAALQTLSKDLYQQPSHFLLELIQNADDNTFSSAVTPSLSLTLSGSSPRYLRTDCNEVGFTLEQVNAIATTGDSTKKAISRRQRGYIGEKGIGFKSVFKVASVVNIVSGYYEFMFERDTPLGMILPVLSPFPSRHRLLDHTARHDPPSAFALPQSTQAPRPHPADLENIDPELLIFLRKLRRLSIETNHPKKTYHVQTDTSDATLGETATIYSTHGDENLTLDKKYAVTRFNASRMPSDTRREGVTRSEVILAFPIDESKSPKMGRHKAFAFLPIDDFGFKFLVHADFLLVASREGLDYGCQWNISLRDAIRTTFLLAVKRFISMPAGEAGPGLRYMWPQYTKHHQSSHDFWNQLHRDILQDLRLERVLESRDASAGFYIPRQLRFTPTKFRFEGDALFDSPSLRKKQLAFQYDGVYGQLELLGVQRTTIQDLCQEFSDWIAEFGVSILDTKPPEWHRKVASLFYGETGLKAHLLSLPIIPLRDGSWVNARRAHLYLEVGNTEEYVPGGINISIVDRAACEDLDRRRFYEFLGIPAYDPKHVCELIMELHSGNASSMADRAAEDLVRDAMYLFKNRDRLGKYAAPDIYFLTTNQEQPSYRKTQVYLIDHNAAPSLIDKYRDTPKNPFYILDDLYERMMSDDNKVNKKAFFQWLLKSPNISTVPILIRDHYPTPEWTFLRDTNVTDLLLVLEELCKDNDPSPRLLQAVPELLVNCQDGTRRPLAELAVPTRDLVRTCPHLDFADLPQPERWGFLSIFGILTCPNTSAILRELDALLDLPIELVDKDVVYECYRGLSRSPDQDRQIISDAFASKPLVFIARPQLSWVTHDSCVWSAPPQLRHVTRLANRYNDCQTLFCRYLGVKPANIKHVADELCCLDGTNPEGIVDRCEELLTILKRYLTPDSEFTASHFSRIRHARVFPVLEVGCSEPTVVLRALQDGNWYIPDQITLEKAFREKVNLLAFSLRSARSLEFLWLKLRCQHLYLSSAVQQTVEPRGSKIHDLSREQDLRVRAKYISSLSTSPETRNSQSSLCAWSVQSVVMIRRLDSVVIEEDNAMVSIDEGLVSANVYFRDTIPHTKQHEVILALADFLSQLFMVSSEDMNLLNALLFCPLEELGNTLAAHNRLLPDEHNVPDEQVGSDEMDFETFDLVEQQHQHLDPSTQSPRVQAQAQYTLHKLIPSLQARSQHISNSAKSFRINKPLTQHTSARERIRSERLQQHLLSIQSSISELPSPPTQNTLPGVSELNNLFGSPPELSASSTTYQVRTREIGFLGELFIHKMFERHINGWSHDYWTSKLRVENGHPPFKLPEGQFSDFTYIDHSGQMKVFLQEGGLNLNTEWSSSTTYHLEVKTTAGSCSEPFFVSQNQVNMMKRFDNDPNNAYVLIRVFDIDADSPGLKFFPSPWSLSLQGSLEFASAGGYQIHQQFSSHSAKMVNVSFLSIAVVATLASFGAARNCTPGLYYCGSALLQVGNYYDPIEDALAAAKKGICADRRHVNDSLFYCLHGTNGDIKYKAFCSKGCSNNGIGKSDSC